MRIFTTISMKRKAENNIFKRLSTLLCLLVFICIAQTLKSQRIEDLHFDILDEKDGLYNHWINEIAFDSIGYLWIGSRDGLYRYDGYSCKLFKHDDADSSTILDDNGQNFYLDKTENLWITYSIGGVSKFDHTHQRFIHYTKAKDDPANILQQNIKMLLVEDNKGFWFSATGKGLCFFDFNTSRITQQNLPDLDTTHSKRIAAGFNTAMYIYDAGDGQWWICSINGLYHFNKATGKLVYKKCPLGQNNERVDCFGSLVPEAKKGLWLASIGGGIVYFDFQTEKFTVHKYKVKAGGMILNNNISFLAPKNEKELWVGSGDRGLGIFNKEDGSFQFRENANTEDYYASKILFTPSQVMFVLENFQILKYNPFTRLFNFKKLATTNNQSKGSFLIQKIIEDPQYHHTYFATDIGDGLVILDQQTGQLTSLPVSSNPKSGDEYMRLYDMCQDAKGQLWVLTRDYLYLLDKQQKKLNKIDPLFNGEQASQYITLRSFASHANGPVWVITSKGEMHLLDVNTKKLLPKINDTLRFKNVPSAISVSTFDTYHHMWVGGKGKLGYFDSSYLQYTPITDSLTNALLKFRFSSMTADHLGNVWIAFPDKGILKLHVKPNAQPIAQFIGTKQGLPTNRILILNVDHHGNLWINSVNGLIYMNTKKNTFRVFNQFSGIDKSTMNLGLFNSGANAFYITSLDKYCKVDFSVLEKRMPVPKIYIDKFRVFDVEKTMQRNSHGEITLNPTEDFFSFEFGCVDYMNQSSNQFAYMLEGWDRDWIYCGSRRYASYTNLKGGHYVFKVKAANIDGIWSEPTSVAIYLDTPFYKKNWFAVLIILFFASIIYALYHYRINQIEKTQQIKTEFNKKIAETRMEALRAQMNPHFIFNCLNSINRYIVKNDIKTSSLYLTRFAKLMRLVLDNSKHKKITLTNEIEALKLYIEMEMFRFEQKFTFDLHIDPNVEMDTIEVPPLIIQPYVENAIWHGLLHKENQGNLRITLHQTDECLLISIQDNGIGRVKAQEYKNANTPTRKSEGMKLTEERLNSQDENKFENVSEIIDLYDDAGQPAGTLVNIKIYL